MQAYDRGVGQEVDAAVLMETVGVGASPEEVTPAQKQAQKEAIIGVVATVMAAVLAITFFLDCIAQYYSPVYITPYFIGILPGELYNNSNDSPKWRDENGDEAPFLPIENIRGRAVCRYWPLSRFGAIAGGNAP